MNTAERLIVALDYPRWEDALALVKVLPEVVYYKVGLEMYLSAGDRAVQTLKSMGKKVFLDLKFHDIPNTAAMACCQACRLGADMINLHAAGGSKMMAKAAADMAAYAAKEGLAAPVLIAVTVLTSMGDEDLAETGFAGSPAENVVRLAGLAKAAGIGGVVASPKEIRDIRRACGEDFLIVCPGVRPAGAGSDDQQRTMTPGEAVAAGADHIVVGRPITKAPEPRKAALAILAEIGGQGR